VSTTAATGPTAEQRDEATASTLAWVALCLVVAWVGVGVLDGGVRLVTTLHLRATDGMGGGWAAVSTLSASLLLGMLWSAALGALALGLAVGVAALVLRGRLARGALLVLLVAASCAAQVLFINLSARAGWSFADATPGNAALVAACGVVVAPLVALAVTWAVLGPVLRTQRSTRVPAAGG
jgi:hypothetical protein